MKTSGWCPTLLKHIPANNKADRGIVFDLQSHTKNTQDNELFVFESLSGMKITTPQIKEEAFPQLLIELVGG